MYYILKTIPILRSKSCFILLVLSFNIDLFAQNLPNSQEHLKDSLKSGLKMHSIHIFRFQKLRPYINLDQRNSFIRNAAINVNGVQLGVLIKEKHVIGLGGYVITSSSRQKVKTKTDKNINANRQLDMKYLTFFYQYVAVDRRFFELDIQAEFGGGGFNIKLYDAQTNKLLFNKSSSLIVTGIGPLIAIKPFRWIGVTGMAGYRFTFEKNTNLNFNGAYYSYGIWLDVRQIIRDSNYYLIKKRKYKRELEKLKCIS